MAHVYEKRKDADGFLYITYTDETTLGAAIMELIEEVAAEEWDKLLRL